MAADPSLLGSSDSSRTLTGVGIALLVLATIAIAAMLAPRFREEFRGDIFSTAPQGSAPSARAVPAAAPPRGALPAAPTRAAPAPVASPPVAVAPSPPVPHGSLSAGETEVAAPSVPLKKATRIHPTPHRASPRTQHAAAPVAPRVEPPPSTRHAQAATSRPRVHETRPGPPLRLDRQPRERWDDPRTWRPGVNRDAPSSSPTDPQRGG